MNAIRNTAAVPWCGAAAGLFSGFGLLVGALVEWGAGVGLRFAASRLGARRTTAANGAIARRIRIACRDRESGIARSALLRRNNAFPFRDAEEGVCFGVLADGLPAVPNERAMEDRVRRPNNGPDGTAIRQGKRR
jgi:hypothetical protein